jgi:glycine/D-amino acid oxidase-like deaminating enzyme
MSSTGMRVVVVGAGIFGVTTAVTLARRHRVTLLDAGPIPNPLAESTDVSKAVRMDYGADEFYAAEMERGSTGGAVGMRRSILRSFTRRARCSSRESLWRLEDSSTRATPP